MNRVSRRTKCGGHGNRHHHVRSSCEPKEHTQQQERNDAKKRESKANSRQDKSKANSKQDKSTANSRQKKKTCEKPKGEHEESMKHTEDLHIQHKVNEELTKNTLKTRTGCFRTERR